jgi:hypothetical protein
MSDDEKDQAEKTFKIKAKPCTMAGFAIGSPGFLHIESASDQVRNFPDQRRLNSL